MTKDMVDGALVAVALRKRAVILSSDAADSETLVAASGQEAVVVAV